MGAILLIAGTTIGAGMLALPVTTGQAGFFPSLLMMTALWLFMMLTAFYLLEVNLRMKGESNIISMVRLTLGRPGEIISWIVYLLLLYALTAAYIVGCSQILEELLSSWISYTIPTQFFSIAVFIIFSLLVYCGTVAVDFLNRFFMIGLIGAYIAMLSMSIFKISSPLLLHADFKFLLPSLSVMATTFGYHIIIPTLTTYLEHDVKSLKKAIFIGSLIPFIVYLLWQLLVMGIVPVYGENSLSEVSIAGSQITFSLHAILHNRWIGLFLRAFAFFAIVTSLLGVSLSLSDFLADGLKIKKTSFGKFFLVMMTFIPPLLFALFYPQGFIAALKYAGICVIILLALLPSAMAYLERYGRQTTRSMIKSQFQVFGGRVGVVLTLIVSLILLAIEVLV